MEPFRWTCPYCGASSVVTEDNYFEKPARFPGKALVGIMIMCANPDCGEYTLKVRLSESYFANEYDGYVIGDTIEEWNLIPPAEAKVFPSYIPEALLHDYREACLIRDLSPKASATLARRCLQGMIRDFWKEKGANLYSQVEAIKDRLRPEVWAAIDAVRSIGNIGAHMEKDINVIVDIDPGEAAHLIWLIEFLFSEWYIARHEREKKLEKIAEIAVKKKAQRQA